MSLRPEDRIGGFPPAALELGRQLILSTRHLSEHTVGEVAEEVRRFGATQLRAYPSAAFGLAVALEHCRSGLRLQSVIAGSEMLYPFQRAKIEEAFGARVYSFYGDGPTPVSK